MKQDNKTTFPTRIVVKEEQRQGERELNKAIDRVRNAYAVLAGFTDLGDLPTIKNITPIWLASLIRSHTDVITADRGLTAQRKEEQITDWKTVQKKANIYVNIIHGFFSEYPNAHLVFDGAINNYSCINKAEIINEIGTHEVPAEAQEYYNLWVAVENAIKNLRKWEEEKNLKKFPLDEILRRDHSPHAFARKWISGMFAKSDFEQRPENEQLRKVYEQNYL